MNWTICLGSLFGGLSLFFLYYGTHLANQRSNQETAETVTTEVHKVLQRIDAVEHSIAATVMHCRRRLIPNSVAYLSRSSGSAAETR
jgi:hypothetical protein